jgi:hypothetical protein
MQYRRQVLKLVLGLLVAVVHTMLIRQQVVSHHVYINERCVIDVFHYLFHVKVTVKREHVLQSAETIFTRTGTNKPTIEVAFEGEPGTGYGPTLEFYASVSRELQRYNLKLWHGDKVKLPSEHNGLCVLCSSF